MRRRILTGIASIAALFALTACSAPTPPGWQIAPLMHDENGPHLFENHHVDRGDVTFFTNSIRTDTAGGLWTTSAGTWLHVAPSGEKLATFNDPRPVTSFVADSPTLLIASSNSLTGEQSSLMRLNSTTRRWTSLLTTSSYLGDVARLDDGAIAFVAFPLGAPIGDVPEPFEIDVLSSGGEQRVLFRSEKPATSVALAADSGATVVVSTENTSFDLLADGTLGHLIANDRRDTPPVIAINPAGDRISFDPTGSPVRYWSLVGGSDEARSILTHPCCGEDAAALTLTRGASSTLLPFTAGAVAAAWLDDTTIVYVIPGGGDASVIATARLRP